VVNLSGGEDDIDLEDIGEDDEYGSKYKAFTNKLRSMQ